MKRLDSILLAAILIFIAIGSHIMPVYAAETEMTAESEETVGEDDQSETEKNEERTSETTDDSGTGSTGTNELQTEETHEEIVSTDSTAADATVDSSSKGVDEETDGAAIPEEIPVESEEDAALPALAGEETSSWLASYTYEVTGDAVLLTAYNGSDTNITVPGRAMVDGTEYSSIKINKYIWNSAVGLSLEKGVTFPEDCTYFFRYAKNLKTLDIRQVDTSNITNMSYMFYGSSLTDLDLRGVDTSNVTDMSYMFENCNSLTELDLSSLDLPNLKYMDNMFRYCRNLSSVDLSDFNAPKLESAGYLFYHCDHLTNVNLNGFDAPNLYFMRSMFSNCGDLTNLDVSSLNTSKATNMMYMFFDCSSLISLDLSSWDTSNLKYAKYMFSGCSSLASLDLSGFNTAGIDPYSMTYMFSGCSSLTSLDLSSFDTSKLVYMDYMFCNCSSLISLNLSSFDTSKAKKFTSMFENCFSLKELDLSGFNMSLAEQTTNMLAGCDALVKIHTPRSLYKDVPLVIALSDRDSNNYTSLPQKMAESIILALPQEFDSVWLEDYSFEISEDKLILTSYRGNKTAVTVPGEAWYNGTHYGKIQITGGLYPNATSLTLEEGVVFPDDCIGLFSSLPRLKTLDFGGVNTSNVTNMRGMFSDCQKLEELNLGSFDTSMVTDMDGMFAGCSNLEKLNLSSFDFSNVETCTELLEGCTSLIEIQIPAGLAVQIALPNVFSGPDGSEYSYAPTGLEEDVILTRSICVPDIPIIKEGPEDVTSPEGTSVIFNVKALGNDLTYQWQYQGKSGSSWTNFVNGTGSVLTKTLLKSWDGWKVRCIVTDGDGDNTISDAARINIVDAIIFRTQPESLEAVEGTTITFRVEAESYKGSSLNYQWQYNSSGKKWNDFNNAQEPVLTRTMLSSYRDWKIRCVIKDEDGNEAVSESAALTLLNPIVITEQPVAAIVVANEKAAFSVTANEVRGKELTYQWQYQGTTTTDWLNFSNAAGPTLTKTALAKWNGWKIRCKISTNGYYLYTDMVTLTVYKDIIITEQPESVCSRADQNVEFRIGAASSDGGNLTYQWQYQGTVSSTWISFKNGTGATLKKTVRDNWDGWKVQCVIRDSHGNSVISEPANIKIVYPIKVTVQPQDVKAMANRPITFSVEAESESGNILNYQWQYQGVSSTKWTNFVNANGATVTKTAAQSWDGWKVRCIITDETGLGIYTDTVTITIR